MQIYPAIDLKAGECVRLTQGSFEQVVIYEKDPLKVAKSFAKQGAKLLHVVDLDGAKEGQSINFDSIKKIVTDSGLQIQTGGGIRTKQQINNILNLGIARVVLGSIAISQPELVKQWLQEFGAEKIVIALDVRFDHKKDPKLALHGWRTPSEKNLWQLLNEYQDSSLKYILCTDIQRDGMLQGPNLDLYRECKSRYPNLFFQASGGISSLNDLRMLKEIDVGAMIIGKAFYENKFSLADALAEIQ